MMPTDNVRPARATSKQAAAPVTIQRVDEPADAPGAAGASRVTHVTGCRRLVDPTASEADLAAAEAEFLLALQEYRRRSGRMFPTWSEVLEVLQGLGYEKAAAAITDPTNDGGAS